MGRWENCLIAEMVAGAEIWAALIGTSRISRQCAVDSTQLIYSFVRNFVVVKVH